MMATGFLDIRMADRFFPSEAPADSAADRFAAEAMPHVNDIFRTAVRMLAGDRARAEDATQESYLRAWQSFARFSTGTNCRAWLFKILFHVVHHHRRQWFRFPGVTESEAILETTIANPDPVPEHVRDEEILAALDRIPAEFRAPILLVDVEEFSYKETAEILRVPMGTVMSRLNRGRKLLRKELVDVARSYGIGKRETA
jgi:RNA polymerase sigma-70 factor (ECF subfamily)